MQWWTLTRSWATATLVLLSQCLLAQHRPFRHYDVEQGLAGSTVYCVQQDSAGYLWFGTATGLSRFDGTSFRNYGTADGLPNNEVLGLVLDQFGRLWILCFEGSLCFLKDGVFHTPANDPSLIDIRSTLSTFGIGTDPEADDVKVVGSEGVYSYTGNTLRSLEIPPGTTTTYWVRTIGGDLWFLNESGLYQRKPGATWELVLRKGSVEIPAIHNAVDLGDNLLINTGQELVRISLAGNRARVKQRIAFRYGLNRASIDGTGALWLSTVEHGAFRFARNNIEEDVPEQFTPSTSVSQCIMDREGILWFASHTDGVFKLLNVQDRLFDVSDRLSSNDLHCVIGADHGVVLAGTGTLSIDHVAPNGVDHLPGLEPRAGVRVLRAVQKAGDRFFISDAGLIKLNADRTLTHWPALGAAKSLLVARDGDLLIATSAGACRVSSVTGQVLDTLLHGRCTALLQDLSGKLLVGGLNGLRTAGSDTTGYGGILNALIGSRVTDLLLCKDGTLVIGTHGKGLLFRRAEGELSWATAEQDGLSSNIIGRLHQDVSGRIWACTTGGLDRLIADGDTWRVRNFTVADGLPDNEVRDVLVRGDSLWVATHKGLALLMGADRSETDDFPMRITGIRFNGRDTLIADGYSVSHDLNDISISFVALHMRSDGRIRYRYRLSDDAPWQFTTANSITIPRATPDTYRFIVQARTAGGTWGAQVARIAIQIAPPWWQRPWVLAMLLLVAIAAASAIFQRRQARLWVESRERERNTKAMAELELQAHRARIDPHFVFNCLNSIQGFVINEDNDKAHRYIAQFASYIRRTLRVARQNFIPLREEIEMLREQTELEMMRTRHAFTTVVEVAPDVPMHMDVPTMLLQTFVENAIKHGLNPLIDRKGELAIRFSREAEGLVCTVEDNGVGMNTAANEASRQKEHASEGLNLVKERIALFNTQFGMDIRMHLATKSDGAGTTVRVLIPLEPTNQHAI